MKIFETTEKCACNHTTDVLCDICGKSCKIQVAKDVYNYNYAELSAHFGYGSDKHDGELHQSELCEECFFKVKDLFKLNTRMRIEL